MAVAAEETFAPPAPGVWFLETTHWTRPVTRFHVELFPEPCRRGAGEGLRRYGSLLDNLDFAFVNGFPYGSQLDSGRLLVLGMHDLLGAPQEFDRRSADNAAASAVSSARSRSAWAGSGAGHSNLR